MATFEEARNCFFPWDQVLTRLISSKDLEFAEVVLRTYPVFQKSPTDLLTDIIELISADASKVEIRGKKKVILTERIQVIDSVLRHWLKLQDDFLRHPELLTMLVNYAEDPKTAHLLSPATKDVIQSLKFSPQGAARKSRKKPPRPASALASSDPFPTEPPEPSTSSSPSEEALGLDFIKVEDLSAALHVSEQRLLSSLTFSELLNQNWLVPERAPTVSSHHRWFRGVVRWFVSDLLSASDEFHQVKKLAKAVTLAVKCKKSSNFGGVMLVLCALHAPAVSQLTQAWGLLHSELQHKLQKLVLFMDPWVYNSPYRVALPSFDPSALPFLGFLLKDLLLINEQIPSRDAQGRVNFTKASNVYHPICNFIRHVTTPSKLPSKKALVSFLMSLSDSTDPTQTPTGIPNSAFSIPPLTGREAPPLQVGLSSRDWAQILDGCAGRHFDKGNVVLMQGVPSMSAFKLISGSVQLVKDQEVVATLRAGNTFGEYNLLSRFGSADISAIATEAVELHEIPSRHLLSLFSTQPILASRFLYSLIDTLAQRLQTTLAAIASQTPLPLIPYSEAVRNHLLRHSKLDQISPVPSHESDYSDSSNSPRNQSSSMFEDATSSDPQLSRSTGPGPSSSRFIPPPSLSHFRKNDRIPAPSDQASSPPSEEQGKHLAVKSSGPGKSLYHAGLMPFSTDSADPAEERKSSKEKSFQVMFNLPPSEMLLAKYDIFRNDMKRRVGRLYASKNFLAWTYHDKVIRQRREVIAISDIVSITVVDEKLELATLNRRQSHSFRLSSAQLSDSCTFLLRLRSSSMLVQVKQQAKPSASDDLDLSFITTPLELESNCNTSILVPLDSHIHRTEQEKNPAFDDIALSDDDRALLLQPHKLRTFSKNEVLYTLSDNAAYRRLYYLAEGTCTAFMIDPHDEAQKRPVAGVYEGTVFGYNPLLSRFVLLCNSVAVSSETAKVYVFEPHHIHLLFFRYPQFQTRFLFFVAVSILSRIQALELYEDPCDRLVPNISDSPLHLDVPRFSSTAFDRLSQLPCCEVIGPSNDEAIEQSFDFNTSSFVCAKTVTTYPYDPLVPPDAHTGKKKRLGDPVCDQFYIQFYQNFVIAAVADGCSWGEAPRDAAEIACRTFVTHVQRYLGTLTDTQQLAKLVLRAFSMAHHSISRGKQHLKSWEVGTTTLFGGVVVPLSHLPPAPSNGSSMLPKVNPPFGFVYVNCGDCKGFRFSAASTDVIDITPDTRQNNDPSDCGGRIGPYVQGKDPDLRNFRLRYLPCFPGDMILVMSDGVYDNIDPEHLGLSPKRFGIDSDTWEGIEFERAEKVRYAYRLSSIREIILANMSGDQPFDPKVIVNSFLQFCLKTNQPAVEWMEQNPARKLPTDYSRFPGKMDHSTVACWVVQEDYTSFASASPPPYIVNP